MAPIIPILTPGTKPPAGHYSQAVVHQGVVYVAGQVPVDLDTGTPRPGPIEEQTALTLGNLERILRAAGSGLDRVLQMTIFLTSIDDWAAVNQVYARIMGAHRPARAVVPVTPLHHGVGIEIVCIAATNPGEPA